MKLPSLVDPHHRVELLANPLADRRGGFSDGQARILNGDALSVAAQAIRRWPGYEPTPLVPLSGLAREAGVGALHYKDESGRFGLGSFKALGGAYAVARLLCREVGGRRGRASATVDELLTGAHADMVPAITVCCATDGNHGRSVAWGARTFGCACVIFIHEGVSESRKAAIERFGARVVRTRGNYDDSVREAGATAAREGWFVVSDTSYPGYTEVPKDVMQGYELMALEAAEQLEAPPTHVFLQTGVGGMAAAVAAHFKRRLGERRPVFVLADPERSACWLESVRAGRPTAVGGALDTVMAGLACGEVSILAWELLSDTADAVVSVTDADAVSLMRRLARPTSPGQAIVAGESAVAGLAALLTVVAVPEAARMLGLDARSRVLVFGTEGDTDPALYRDLVGMSGDEVRAGAHRGRAGS